MPQQLSLPEVEGRHWERGWCHGKKKAQQRQMQEAVDLGTVIQAERTRVRRGTNRKSETGRVIERQTELQQAKETVTEKDEPLAELHTGNETSC